MRRSVLFCLIAGIFVFGTVPFTQAATEVQKQAAIDKGLEWLAQQQQAGGEWLYPLMSDSHCAVTSAAVWAFTHKGYNAGSDVIINSTNYGDVVGAGLDYIFSTAVSYNIGPQSAGDPDVNGNGIGVYFGGSGNGRMNFNTSFAVLAITATGTPSEVITVGSQAGRTYIDVVQDAVEFFAFGQYDSGGYRGGWRFTPNSGAGQENSPWICFALIAAEEMGATVPSFVKSELTYWLNYVQYYNGSGSGLDGSSGFTNPNQLNSESKTGGLLGQMLFAEIDVAGGGLTYDLSHPRLLAALGYLNRQWATDAYGCWYGNCGNPYAMWSIYAGLQITVGLDDTTHITNLRGSGTIDPGDTPNWYEDYCEYLVQSQYADGSWDDDNYGCNYYAGALTTAWYVDILPNTSTQTISGYVYKAEGGGLEDVVVTADGQDPYTTTGPNGYYEIEVPSEWSGTVTPSKDGWSFEPTSRTYSSVTASQTGQNYTAYVPSDAISWSVTQLTTNGDNDSPRVSGSGIAWRNYDRSGPGDYEVFYHDGSVNVQVTDNDVHDYGPDIDGTTVVWGGADGTVSPDADTEVKVWSGSGTTSLTANDYSDNNPLMSGSYIVWKAWPGTGNVLRLYNGSSTNDIPASGDASAYQIDGNRVVWHYYDGEDAEIFYFDGSTTTQLTNNSTNDFDPVIEGDIIAWYGGSGSSQEIYIYDISTAGPVTAITNNSNSDQLPDISGNFIVWRGWDGSDYEIFYYNLVDGTTHQVTDNAYPDSHDAPPKIGGSLIVWEAKVDGSTTEIAVYDILTQQSYLLTSNGVWDRYPETSGQTIAWTSEGEIYKAVRAIHNTDKDQYYSSIQAAIDDADPCDTINVGSGTYDEVLTIDKALTLAGQDRDTTTIDGGGGSGDVIQVSANYVNISGFTVTGAGGTGHPDYNAGILFSNVQSCRIENCRSTANNRKGIYLFSSSNNEILNNDCSSNDYYSIRLSSSSNNKIEGNICTNSACGVSLTSSSMNNDILNNNCSSNWANGLLLDASSNSNILDNNNCTGTGSTYEAVRIHAATGNTIKNCTCSHSNYGIHLTSAGGNHIYNNEISNTNTYGIRILSASNNVVCNCNFLNNTNHAIDTTGSNFWDNGYPSGGNYWDTYTGADDYHGPDQDILGPDGIVDAPYTGSSGVTDNYPWVAQYGIKLEISGYITLAEGGAGLEGVEVTGDGVPGPYISLPSGYYRLEVPEGWSGNVTPTKNNCEFVPVNRSYVNVTSDQTDQNFTASPSQIISGYVTYKGVGLENVWIAGDNGAGSDTTDPCGYYELEVSYNWSGTITPVKYGCTFDPADRNYSSVIEDQSDQNFVAYVSGSSLYKITDLGTLNGYDIWVKAVNNSDQVAGWVMLSKSMWDALLWEDGQTTLLGLHRGEAEGINDSGYVVGHYVEIGTWYFKAFLWDKQGGVIDLGTLGGSESWAYGINDTGEVVGQAINDKEEKHAFMRRDATMFDLGTLGGQESLAHNINKDREVVGWSLTDKDEKHAFIWENDVMTDLDTLPGYLESEAHSINANSEVVGWSSNGAEQGHAFLWKEGKITDLGTLGGDYGRAYSINDSGQIVGKARIASGDFRAALFDPTGRGNNINLNDLIFDHGHGWTLTEAKSINGNGCIVGHGMNPQGETRGFLLTPTTPVLLDFEDVADPCTGTTWMPPWTPYNDIESMEPSFMAYEVGYSESWVRSKNDADGDPGRWSVVNWGGGNSTRTIVFKGEVDFHGAWFTRGQTWYQGAYVAAKWVQIVGKDKDGNVVDTTEQLDLDYSDRYPETNYDFQYLQANMHGVKTLEITSFNDEYNTSYYQIDNLAYSLMTPHIDVLDPCGAEILFAGQTYTVSWDNEGIINEVVLEYSSDNGQSWNPVVGPIANTGSYEWLLPEVTSDQCMVRITDAGDSQVSASSAVFSIYTRGAVGDAYISWYGSNNVVQYDDVTSIKVGQFGSDTTGPYDVEFGTGGNMFVGSYSDNCVLEYDGSTGALIGTFVPSGSGGLSGLRDMEFGPNGNLFVLSKNNKTIIEYDGGMGALVSSFVLNETNDPRAIAFSAKGSLMVASYRSHAVLEYDRYSGNFLRTVVTGGLLQYPEDIDFGPDGALYIASWSNRSVLRWDDPCGALTTFVPTASGDLSCPEEIEFTPNGEFLYVADWYNHKIKRYNGSDGSYIDAFVDGGGELGYPSGLTFKPLRELRLLDPNGGDTLTGGDTYKIGWEGLGGIRKVLIEFSSNNGSDWTIVEPNAPNTDISDWYDWLVPEGISSDQCLIRITDAEDSNLSATSDSVFKVIPGILDFKSTEEFDENFNVLVDPCAAAGGTHSYSSEPGVGGISGRINSEAIGEASNESTSVYHSADFDLSEGDEFTLSTYLLADETEDNEEPIVLGMVGFVEDPCTGMDEGRGQDFIGARVAKKAGNGNGKFRLSGHVCNDGVGQDDIDNQSESFSLTPNHWHKLTTSFMYEGDGGVSGNADFAYAAMLEDYGEDGVTEPCEPVSVITGKLTKTNCGTEKGKFKLKKAKKAVRTHHAHKPNPQGKGGGAKAWDKLMNSRWKWKHRVRGDFNLDWKVDILDFAILSSAWLTHPCETGWKARYDISKPRDFVIDPLDLDVFLHYWLERRSAPNFLCRWCKWSDWYSWCAACPP